MPLTQDQLKRFEARLLEERDRLSKDLGTITTKDTSRPGDYDAKFPNFGKDDVGDSDELQDAVEEFDAAIGIGGELEGRLNEVEAALKAIEDGTYGICISCREPVPPERLEANPAALRCVSCKTKLNQL